MAYKTHLSAKDYTTGCLSNLNQQFNQTKSEIEKLVEFFHTTIEQQEWEINHLKSLLEISSESPKKIQELEKKHHKELADKDDIITSLSLVIQSIEDISLNNSISQPKRNDLKVEDFSDFSPTFSFNHFGSRSTIKKQFQEKNFTTLPPIERLENTPPQTHNQSNSKPKFLRFTEPQDTHYSATHYEYGHNCELLNRRVEQLNVEQSNENKLHKLKVEDLKKDIISLQKEIDQYETELKEKNFQIKKLKDDYSSESVRATELLEKQSINLKEIENLKAQLSESIYLNQEYSELINTQIYKTESHTDKIDSIINK